MNGLIFRRVSPQAALGLRREVTGALVGVEELGKFVAALGEKTCL